MFWALVIEPNKRYTQVVSKSFHVSMACMDLETADNEVTSVMLEVGEEKLILCNLSKNKYIQQPLDLNFQVGDEISFYTKGKASVHLTGYLIIGEDFPGLMSDQESEDEDEEEEEEDEEEAKERLKAMASKAMKRGIEEKSSKNKKPKLDSSVGEEDESDEDDEDFELEEESSDEESGEEGVEQAAFDSSSDDDSEEAMDVSVKKGKKEGGGGAKKDEAMAKAAAAKKQTPSKKEEKKSEAMNGTPTLSAKKKKQKDGATPKVKGETPKTPKTDEIQKKTLPGGVGIEDLKVGNGPVAKAGRMVTVYYVGRLKHNNKQFDSTQQGPGFKFRLGSNEVIKGWDLGVSGMKVGGKRKIVCPPNMAYGAKGSPPVIPPNSSLVFEVELKSVN